MSHKAASIINKLNICHLLFQLSYLCSFGKFMGSFARKKHQGLVEFLWTFLTLLVGLELRIEIFLRHFYDFPQIAACLFFQNLSKLISIRTSNICSLNFTRGNVEGSNWSDPKYMRLRLIRIGKWSKNFIETRKTNCAQFVLETLPDSKRITFELHLTLRKRPFFTI